MRGAKAMVLAIALVVSAAAMVGVGTTQSWFSDTESTDVTITTAPLFTLDDAGWDGATVCELDAGTHNLVPNYSGCTVSISEGVSVTAPDGTVSDGGTLMKGTTYTIEGSGTFSLAYSPGSVTITLVMGGTS